MREYLHARESGQLTEHTSAITLDTYSHVVEGMDADAATTVADQIFKKAKEWDCFQLSTLVVE